VKRVQFALIFAILYIIASPLSAYAAELPDIAAKSYILTDFDTGAVLAEHQADEPLPPASMTKMMTEFIVLDKIKSGEIHWDDVVTVSQRAAAINEAQINLRAGDKITVRELFIATAVQSANDAAVALAEYVGGSEENFVKMMNDKARQLGLTHTHFANATGLNREAYPDPPKTQGEHVMSARDLAILATQLIKTHPEILSITSLSQYTFFKGTNRQKTYKNWNMMLPGLPFYYEGVDGVKTGHTDEAGYCFTGTAKRGGYRLITVIMGAKTELGRFTETKKLLDYGFENYEDKVLVENGKPVPGFETLQIENGVDRSVPVVVSQTVKMPMKRGEENKYSYRVTFFNVKAPITKGTPVGRLEIYYQNQPIPGFQPVVLVAAKDVEEASWIQLFFREIGDTISRLFD
jgi:D-alanyl-D-alanine carboxypeptidase (penicillin-binding protein 5/6)